MKGVCSLIACLWLITAICVSAQEPLIRTSMHDADVWKGQKVTLVVEVLVPGYFSDSPTFDLPDPPGILLLPPNVNPVVSTEEISGISYTIQRHELSIISQRIGSQNVPEFDVRFHYKRNALDKESIAVSLKTQPVHLNVKAPLGSEKLGDIISAHNLEASDVWKPIPKDVTAKPGTAFTRTITFKAQDTPAMAFPPFPTMTLMVWAFTKLLQKLLIKITVVIISVCVARSLPTFVSDQVSSSLPLLN